MQDPLYRMDVCIQAMGYTQTPMTTGCFSASEPHIGLRLPPGKLTPGEEASAELVAVAPPGQALNGTVRIEPPAGANVTPSELRLNVPAGKVETHAVRLKAAKQASPLSASGPPKLVLTYDGSGGPLKSELALRAQDLPLTDTTRVQAEDFVKQGGGSVQRREDKVGADGACFSHWDDEGHWLEWTVPAAKAGDYCLVLRYCTPIDVARRIEVDGKPVSDSPVIFPSTGGFSSDANDWAHARRRQRDERGLPAAVAGTPVSARPSACRPHLDNLFAIIYTFTVTAKQPICRI
jgi:hypothetical protein